MTTTHMDWIRLLSQKRLGQDIQSTTTSNGRSKFQSDIDRIVFSPAFRRLAKKTQVHPLAPNDHVHNRLTHSLEVARVGAALGNAFGHAMGSAIKERLPARVSPADLSAIVHAAVP
jgi:dGTPase